MIAMLKRTGPLKYRSDKTAAAYLTGKNPAQARIIKFRQNLYRYHSG
jgi:hypothetical protein